MRISELLDQHDAVICDLDGVVYRGATPIRSAIEALAAVRRRGLPVLFATNNDTRTHQEIADRLTAMGLTTEPHQIVSAPQVIADLIVRQQPTGAKAAVWGAPALSAALRAAGIATSEPGDGAAILVQGLTVSASTAGNADTTDLVRLAAAIDASDRWFITNADPLVVRESGPIPGNGAIVRSLRGLTTRTPLLAGKPEPHLLHLAAASAAASRPLVIGDQLDTDIAAAHAAGMASLLVMTGLCSQDTLRKAPAHTRPTYHAPDLSVLLARF
jgi:glycerol-1-phosphatase